MNLDLTRSAFAGTLSTSDTYPEARNIGVTNLRRRLAYVLVIVLSSFVIPTIAVQELLNVSLHLVRRPKPRSFHSILVVCRPNDQVAMGDLVRNDNLKASNKMILAISRTEIKLLGRTRRYEHGEADFGRWIMADHRTTSSTAEAAPEAVPGRKPLDNRAVLTGILFVLKTGIAWEDLPQELGCGSGMTCWRRLAAWQKAGVWDKIHRALLDRLREADLIDWSRAAADSTSVRAVFGGTKPAPTPRIAVKPGRSITWRPTETGFRLPRRSPRPMRTM